MPPPPQQQHKESVKIYYFVLNITQAKALLQKGYLCRKKLTFQHVFVA
jgi:hypothetical protein